MMVLWILETSLHLFFSIIADYIQIQLVDFFEILGCVIVVDLIRNFIGLYFENLTEVQESTMIKKQDEDKFVRTVVPTVHSLMIYKICQGLDLKVQLAAEKDRITWVAKETSQNKEKRPIPKVKSKTILMFCEALNIDAELSVGREPLPENQLKLAKPLPIVQSIMVFKMCEGLGLRVKLDGEIKTSTSLKC
ncbi:hypothetical protein TNCT_558641 [Trichonephila clavata]|uniref:Uncharacterized protein n=1 Tax=Trichonephila clavata TaxID=2740835 RepID=A0A8X6HPS4_TRICU|nr:hypothetical protein TNCT_558641 [Trichonephila clavata]